MFTLKELNALQNEIDAQRRRAEHARNVKATLEKVRLAGVSLYGWMGGNGRYNEEALKLMQAAIDEFGPQLFAMVEARREAYAVECLAKAEACRLQLETAVQPEAKGAA